MILEISAAVSAKRSARDKFVYLEWKLLEWDVNKILKREIIGRTSIQDEYGLNLGHHDGGQNNYPESVEA